MSYSDRAGGAAIAAFRQHEALVASGIDSRMLVAQKQSSSPQVTEFQSDAPNWPQRTKERLGRFLNRLHKKHTGVPVYFQYENNSASPALAEASRGFDVLNLHLVFGLADYGDLLTHLPSDIPVVITMHDLSAFTGGCFYPGECRGFESGCQACPLVKRRALGDPARQGMQQRTASYQSVRDRVRFVADSSWLASEAKASQLLRNQTVDVIHYGIDTKAFAPIDRSVARSVLNLDQDALLIGFAAADVSNPRKGMKCLVEALSTVTKAAAKVSNMQLISWGRGQPRLGNRLPQHHFGNIESEKLMPLLYSATDIFVVPSLEEAFGQTALEAAACGTPVVAFDTGGIPDIVRDGENGILAECGNTDSLSNAIIDLVNSPERRHALGTAGRDIVTNHFSYADNAKKYTSLYHELLDSVAADGDLA